MRDLQLKQGDLEVFEHLEVMPTRKVEFPMSTTEDITVPLRRGGYAA